MNKYKSNHEFYKSVFDEVHVSDELMKKVQNMSENKPKKKVYAIRKIIYVAAAILVLLVASNVVTYAATGATWIERLVTINVNGQDQEAKLINKYDENGKLDSQGIMIDRGNGIKRSLEWDGEYAIDDFSDFDIHFVEDDPELIKKDDKIYLDWNMACIHEDITKDFADGKAEVTVLYDNNEELKFTITGTADKYKIVVSNRGESVEYNSDDYQK